MSGWVHYAIRCSSCNETGWGFDASNLVWYNAGHLVKGNFKRISPFTYPHAKQAHLCQCGNQVIAETIFFKDYKLLVESGGDKNIYEIAVDKYRQAVLRQEIAKLSEAISQDAVLMAKGEIVIRCKQVVEDARRALETGRNVELRKGALYIRYPGYERFKRVEI